MNKHVKRKWLKALRSGEYPKSSGALCRLVADDYDPIGYCCLGVLVEEIAPEFFQRVSVDGKNKRIFSGEEVFDGYLPDDLAIMFDLDERTQTELGILNDDASTFGPVADYIEKNL